MSANIRILEWDTRFFGYKVAKTDTDYLWSDSISKLEGLYKKDIELVIHNSSKPDFEKLSNKFYDIVKVYNRIPIIKEVKSLTRNNPNIFSYKEEFVSQDLISLAKLAGREGRFGRDPRFSENTYNRIFEEWISNSVKRIVADDVLVYENEGKIVGFATVKINGNKGFAPLFAVHRNFEGKGVSFALMRAVENKLIEENCKYLISGTQEINKKALSSFKRFGMEFQAPEYVYHLWKKDHINE